MSRSRERIVGDGYDTEQHDEPAAVPISRMLRQFGPSTSGRRSYKTTRPFVVGQLLQNFW